MKLGPVGPGMQRSQSMKSPVGRKGNAARNRTSRYIGVGSSNRKNQWQARILVHGKVSHSAKTHTWHVKYLAEVAQAPSSLNFCLLTQAAEIFC